MADPGKEAIAKAIAAELVRIMVKDDLELDETVDLISTQILVTGHVITTQEFSDRVDAIRERAARRRHPAGKERGTDEAE